jgi:tRNA pseudouridine55 synthase
MYSAKRIGGRRLCDLARKGETIERQPSRVTIHSIEVLEDRLPEEVVIRVVCGSGTYIRTLGKDLGEALGTGAYLQELRRTRIGKFRVEDAVGPKEITRENWEGRIVSQ